jgi:hypothetical protein
MAADSSAPPVFNKNIDLHKGHKPDVHHHPHPPQQPQQPHRAAPAAQTPPRRPFPSNGGGVTSTNKVSPSPDRSSGAMTHQSAHSVESGTGNSTSSTSLWLAQTDPKPLAKSMSQSDHTNGSSYYEEEVVSTEDDEETEGYLEEELVGGAPSERSMGSGNELDLFPEHVSTIRFDEYDEMQTVLHINDYSKHEINRSWYKREDYDKMVKLARKTAEKAEERRKELEEIARQQKREKLGLATPSFNLKEGRRPAPSAAAEDPLQGKNDSPSQRSHRTSGHARSGYGDDEVENGGDSANRSPEEGDHDNDGNAKDKEKKPIEYRGLEAWTASGAAKVKILKESAIELVWNEQSRQWDAGLFDPDAIRRVYLAVSQTAAAAALERGKSDAAIVKRLQELEAIEKEKKRRRRLLGKSKALVKKSVKMTGRGVTQTGKLMRKTTKKTTKVAKEVTKRGVKAGVATATLDSRMMKEALKVSMKRRECKHETIVRPSNAHLQEETGKFARRLFQISFLVVALC